MGNDGGLHGKLVGAATFKKRRRRYDEHALRGGGVKGKFVWARKFRLGNPQYRRLGMSQ
ncbi:hypothetical protein RMSM_07243 [Rhodopirellula maiorica SM1]|uniref:Uncharacterized protein n=1 Tax=Rhodopirellula maiorica SM1 TaxID=1265738 RepID=M5R8Y6_9BACT|nr:hypothetical protein RMSM_07243 [Rhodopirellula maiorica SM1]